MLLGNSDSKIIIRSKSCRQASLKDLLGILKRGTNELRNFKNITFTQDRILSEENSLDLHFHIIFCLKLINIFTLHIFLNFSFKAWNILYYIKEIHLHKKVSLIFFFHGQNYLKMDKTCSSLNILPKLKYAHIHRT